MDYGTNVTEDMWYSGMIVVKALSKKSMNNMELQQVF